MFDGKNGFDGGRSKSANEAEEVFGQFFPIVAEMFLEVGDSVFSRVSDEGRFRCRFAQVSGQLVRTPFVKIVKKRPRRGVKAFDVVAGVADILRGDERTERVALARRRGVLAETFELSFVFRERAGKIPAALRRATVRRFENEREPFDRPKREGGKSV